MTDATVAVVVIGRSVVVSSVVAIVAQIAAVGTRRPPPLPLPCAATAVTTTTVARSLSCRGLFSFAVSWRGRESASRAPGAALTSAHAGECLLPRQRRRNPRWRRAHARARAPSPDLARCHRQRDRVSTNGWDGRARGGVANLESSVSSPPPPL